MKKIVLMLVVLAIITIVPVDAMVAFPPPGGVAGAGATGGSMFDWISDVASSANAGLDQVYQGIVTVGSYIETIPSQLFYAFLALMMGLFFPLVEIFNFMYMDVNVLYSAVAPVANLFLNAPNWSLGFISNWTPSHAPTVLSSAETSISSTSIWIKWLEVRSVNNTTYAIASITLLLIAILLNFSLRAAKFILWLYSKIPWKAT